MTLSTKLSNQIQKTILRCDFFQSQQQLRALFISEKRLIQWGHQLPDGINEQERLALLIDLLSEDYDVNENNGLLLFLQVLYERANPQDSCHQELSEFIMIVSELWKQVILIMKTLLIRLVVTRLCH